MDTNQTITADTVEEFHQTESKTIDIIHETETMMEPTTMKRNRMNNVDTADTVEEIRQTENKNNRYHSRDRNNDRTNYL